MTAFRSLGRYAAHTLRARRGPRCELCASPIAPRHRHVVDLAERRLLCGCDACALLFPTTGLARYRGVPTDVRQDGSALPSAADLDRLGIPVGLAFLFRASALGRWTAAFPGPSGVAEAELPDGAWETFASTYPLARTVADDVEAFLIYRRRTGRTTALAVPIDVCYEMTALLREHFRGIDGGDASRDALEAFLGDVEGRARAP